MEHIECYCRELKEEDFPNKEAFLARLKESDLSCGSCVDWYEEVYGDGI